MGCSFVFHVILRPALPLGMRFAYSSGQGLSSSAESSSLILGRWGKSITAGCLRFIFLLYGWLFSACSWLLNCQKRSWLFFPECFLHSILYSILLTNLAHLNFANKVISNYFKHTFSHERDKMHLHSSGLGFSYNIGLKPTKNFLLKIFIYLQLGVKCELC